MKYTLIKSILLLGMATLTLPALAARFESIETAYEVPASDVTLLPAGKNGTLVFKPCETCADSKVRLSPTTRFVVNRKPVSKQEFRPALRKSKGLVYVFVLNASNEIARIELDE